MNLLKPSLYLVLILCLFLACKEKTKEDPTAQAQNTNSEETSIHNEIQTANSKWKAFINLKSDSLSTLYTEHAIKIFDDGETIVGGNPLKEHYLSSADPINLISSDTVLMANSNRGLVYEMGEYTDNSNAKFKQIVIWESKDSQSKRVFEFASKIEGSENDLVEINSRRDLWIKLCNMNDAENLINEMYSQNTLYFNHKPLIIGRELLVKEYAYMNRENYQLTLNPIIVDQVNENFVFEIGQCKGSYNGKYIIIWRKESSGKWEVFIDSNI